MRQNIKNCTHYIDRFVSTFLMWRNFSMWQIFMWTNSPHNRLSCGQILDMTDYHVEKFSTWEMWRKFVMWRNNVSNLWCFVAFYAVLLQYLFCSDLRTFAWRKIQPRITPSGEKWLILDMPTNSYSHGSTWLTETDKNTATLEFMYNRCGLGPYDYFWLLTLTLKTMPIMGSPWP